MKYEIIPLRRRFGLIRKTSLSLLNKTDPCEPLFSADAYEGDNLLAFLQHRKASRRIATPTFSKTPV
jgi:hypothetical protein